MLRPLAMAALLSATSLVHAAGFSYDYIEGGYGEVDKGDSLFLGGSKALDKKLYVLGGVHALDFPHGIDGFYLRGGLGFHVPLAPKADFFADGQLLYANVDWNQGDDDDLGAIARAGVRLTPVKQLELEGSLALSSNDYLIDDGVGLNLSARYLFDPQFSAAIGVSHETEFDGLTASLRYQFK